MIMAIIIFVVIPSFKDRVIPVKKLIITPAIFMYLFYQTINENFIPNTWIIAFGFITGIVIGILIRSKTSIKSDKNQLLIWLPGNYLSLVIFCLIFSIHFAIGYLQSVNPGYLSQASSGEQILLFLISCVSSITIGANGLLYCKYLLSDSSELAYTRNQA
jgi:hypothetical protein